MSLIKLLLILILVMILFSALPLWPYSTNWGYYPSGGFALLLIILLLVLFAGVW